MRGSILVSFLLLVQMAYFARSARRVDANARARETLQRRRETAVKAKRALEEDVFTKEELFQLTPGEKLEQVVESRDALGNTVERLQESYRGVPVLDGVVTVKKSQGGQLTGDASGTLIQEIDDDLAGLEEEITADEAIDIAIKAESDDRNSIGDIKVKKVIILDDQDVAKMVYRVTYLIDGIKRPVSFVDSKTGLILRRYNSLNTYPCKNKMYNAIGGNQKMGKIEYGRVPYCLNPTREGDTCYLENNFVRVVDMRNKTFENITDTASFPCHIGYADKINGAFSPAVDAFYFGTLFGKMFKDWFKRQPLKEKMVLRVHYDEMMEGAFWNGENSTFGDGNSTHFYPLVTMDIVAHEVGHGITEQSSGLVYYGESGGVNEAFSDIMGDTAEMFMHENDLLVGQYVMKKRPYIREFERPENDNRSISHVSNMTEDLDSHLSSGVYRRIWYILVGEKGVPVQDAAEVFLHANSFYWHYMDTFQDCSCGLLKAAIDLGYDTEPYIVAFLDVGLDPCDPSTHIFSLSNNKTQSKITVSEEVRPVFRFSTPDWADRILVHAQSESVSNASIHIKVYKLEEGQQLLNKEVLAENEGSVDVATSPGSVLIKLSSSDWVEYIDVRLTAGYTCLNDFNSTSSMDNILYNAYCFGNFES